MARRAPRITLGRMTSPEQRTPLPLSGVARWRIARVGPRELVFVIWALLAIFALVQWLADRSRTDALIGRMELAENIALIVLWGCATPAIVWSTRRLPDESKLTPLHALSHLGFATALILGSNLIVRLPQLAPPFSIGLNGIVQGTLLAFAHYAPAAMAVYLVIAALGYRAWAPERAPRGAPRSAPAARGGSVERVVVREWNRVHLVPPADIHWVEADDNNVVVHTASRTYKGRGRISDLETQLDGSTFVRIHRSAIVNVPSIREVQPLTKGDLAVVMRDGKVLRVSRGRRAALESVLRVPI